jgi:hypothetical protein
MMDAYPALEVFVTVWAALAAGAAIGAYLAPLVLPLPLKRLVGEWWMYGYFYERNTGHHFYVERARMRHKYIWPWRLYVESWPVDRDTGAAQLKTVYRGTCWYRSCYIYVQAQEPIYDDQTFEIYRRVMDERHDDDQFVGLHLGKAYDDTVFEAGAVIMRKEPLAESRPDESPVARRTREEAEFKKVIELYTKCNAETGELLIR